MNIKRTRIEQFTADFENFPLDDSILDQEFSNHFFYIRTFGFKERVIQALIVSFLSVKNKIIKESPNKNKIEEINKETEGPTTKETLVEFFQSVSQPIFPSTPVIASNKKFLGLFQSPKNTFIKLIDLILRITRAVILLPVLFIFSPFFPLIIFTKIFIKNFKKGNVDGYYSIFDSKPRVNIHRIHRKIDSNIAEAIISHEHIHLLQDIFINKNKIKCYSLKTDSLKEILEAQETHKLADLRYIFSPLEVEARLHELFLNYYRYYKKIPSTLDQFILMTEKIYCLSYKEPQNTQDEKNIKIVSRAVSHVDLYFIKMLSIMKCEYKEKYINEVLSLHFANLLLYYNLTEISRALTKEIESKELPRKIYRIIE